MATKTILLDIGGTFIKRSDGRQFPARSGESKGDISDAIRKAIGPLRSVGGVGIAIPGPFDYKRGIFLMKHKYASVYGESFRTLAKLPASIEVKYHHDVNALLLGAIKLLNLTDKSVALVTLGTGLGFGYAIDGQVQYAPDGSPAMSLWNMPAPGGGILEDELSAKGICNAYTNATGEPSRSSLAVARMAYSGNPDAIEVYGRIGRRLGEVLSPIIKELGISTLLMGGQISKSLSLMSGSMQNELPGVEIHPVPETAVFVGLASLFDDNTNNQE